MNSCAPSGIVSCAILAAMALGGCVEPATAPTDSSSSTTPVVVPRLTGTEVLALADARAKADHERYEPFDLKFYPDRKAQFEPEQRAWWVLYWHTPNRHPGDHFAIRIDDATGAIEVFGGA